MSDSFKYVFIPHDDSKPIDERIGNGSGGLTDDELGKTAKAYFNSDEAGDDAVDLRARADQIRKQVRAAGGDIEQLNSVNDEDLVNMVKGVKTCEITALTIPTPVNQYLAVSMYGDDHARNKKLPLNSRASLLRKACGHESEIYGDVFVGRCHDNESEDIWKRVDFLASEVDPDSDWCKLAKTSGGGSGGSFDPNAAAQFLQTKQQQKPFQEQDVQHGVKWSQTDDEVEIRVPNMPANTKAKYIKVSYKPNALKVSVSGSTFLNGKTGGFLIPSDCAWTLQDSDEGRELCITLAKKQMLQWNFAVK